MNRESEFGVDVPPSPLDDEAPVAPERDRRVSRNALLMVVFALSMIIVLGLVVGGAVLYGAEDELDAVEAYDSHFEKAFGAITRSAEQAEGVIGLIETGELTAVSVKTVSAECSASLRVAERELTAAERAIADVDASPEKTCLNDSISYARQAADALQACIADCDDTIASYEYTTALDKAHTEGDRAVTAAVMAANKEDYAESARQAKRATERYEECRSRVASLAALQQEIDYQDALKLFAAEMRLARDARSIAQAGMTGSRSRYEAAVEDYNERSNAINAMGWPESLSLVHWDDPEEWSGPVDAAHRNHDTAMTAYGY